MRKADAVDHVEQYEAGVRYRSDPFELSVTAFHVRTDEQNYEATSQRFLDRVYKATGMEVEAAFRKGVLDVRAAATYTDSRIAGDAITPANEGNRPRRQARLAYQVTPTLDFDSVRAGLNIVGRTRAYAQDSNQLVFPGFTQVNAFVSVRPVEKVTLSLAVNNLFDVLGFTEAEEGAISGAGVNYIRARSITGRTVSASVRYAF